MLRQAFVLAAFIGASALGGCSLVNDFDEFDFDAVDGAAVDGASVDGGDAAVPSDSGIPDGADGSAGADSGPLFCAENQRVVGGACVDCPPRSSRPAGDPADGPDTECSCDPGTTPTGVDQCEPVLCDEGQRVEGNTCVPCPANSTNESGDDASGADSACTCDDGFGGDGKTSCVFGACNEDFRVMSGECVACPANSSNEGGDLLTGRDSECDCNPGTTGDGIASCEVVTCPAMQRVESHECISCPAMSTNASGDDASGEDTACDCIPGSVGDGRTSCDEVLCGLNQRVQDHLCVACPERSTNTPGDNATGADTRCDCIPNTTGPSCDPVCGDGVQVMGEACDDGNAMTESSCPYGEPTCMVCNASCTALVGRSGPFCGDGTRQPAQEACDDGTNAGATTGECVDCLGLVTQELTIRDSSTGSSDGRFGSGDVIAFADGLCAHLGNYQAMFADGVGRRATTTPYVGNGQLNWVLHAFTAYYNIMGEHVWTTDDSALLGVRDGAPAPLLHAIDSTNAVWTGMSADHTTTTDSCIGWTSNLMMDLGSIGNSGRVNEGFLEVGLNACDLVRGVYCAEQP